MVDEHHSQAKKIRAVQDNLNTRVKASLYKAFAPAEARFSINWSFISLHPQAWELVEYGRN